MEADSTRLNLEPESHFFTKNEIPSANYGEKCNFGMLKNLCVFYSLLHKRFDKWYASDFSHEALIRF